MWIWVEANINTYLPINVVVVYEWKHQCPLDRCDIMIVSKYNGERVKTFMDIITLGKRYDWIANPC